MNRLKGFAAGMLLAATALSGTAASTFVGDRTDFRDETIYFAMTTRFYDGDPTNNVCGWDHQDVQIANNDPDWRGDFKGLIDKLDYIKALGFTAIWITPIVQNSSGTDFHGYHAMDFSKVDLRYESRTNWGASQDVKFQDLIDAAHAKGMKIVLDIVLNHTGNFGEAHFCELFTRSEDIRNQASVSASMIPNYDLLPANYNDLNGTAQYNARFPYLKNTDGQNHDNHNYWHHVGTGWNWDLPNRWWGQIAGDCVDLNTENPAVSNYLVQCYGKFIEMGVDGFRIDTTGHISRATFNSAFIPQFLEIAEKNKDKRLNGCPFFMFGECCARFSDVTYRDQPNLSSYFYTWKSPESITSAWNWDETFWDNIYVKEGDDSARPGNMALCDAEPSEKRTSDNVFMKNGAWHEPDYSDYSGFSIIDFPMHYNFNNQSAAVNVAKSGDQYYNDASFNVVYVDSHDYCPGPNDGTRFNGGTGAWAENLALMFTFRGIPCIYYGSEVEFQKGCKVDAGGTDMPVKESGRAYFGHYLEGSVNASDFGVYTASGNVEQTLNADLAQHIIRLNKIRAAVPALRKGQYTWDGCSANGGHAFKRAYKDSYALVALNGGATFTNVPAGKYVDVVTGKEYQGGGTITVEAPATQGQVRVLVKDWTGGVIGEDGKFIYASQPVPHGGSVSFSDPGATQFYTADDAVSEPTMQLSPNGGSFKTETLDVEITLSSNATSGWYKVDGGTQVNVAAGNTKTVTIGNGLQYGESTVITWGVKGDDGKEYTGKATYKKVDPNASFAIYVEASSAPNIYVWGKNDAGTTVEVCGAWPGKQMSDTEVIDGKTFYYVTIDDLESVSFILNNGSAQTGDITGISDTVFYSYNGGDSATKLDNIDVTPKPRVALSPNGGEFSNTLTVTATAYNATRAWYQIGNGSLQYFTGAVNFTIGTGMIDGETVTVKWGAENGENTESGQAVYTKVAEPSGYTIYFDNTQNWGSVYAYVWNHGPQELLGTWPGTQLTKTVTLGQKTYYAITVDGIEDGAQVIFNNGGGTQTKDLEFLAGYIYNCNGDFTTSSVEIATADEEAEPEFYTLQGVRVAEPTPGIYIVRRGSKTYKAVVR